MKRKLNTQPPNSPKVRKTELSYDSEDSSDDDESSDDEENPQNLPPQPKERQTQSSVSINNKFIKVKLQSTNLILCSLTKDGNVVEEIIKKGVKKSWFFVDKNYGKSKTLLLINKKQVKVSETSTFVANDKLYNEHLSYIDSFYLKTRLPFLGHIQSINPLTVKRRRNLVFTLYSYISNDFIIFKKYLIKFGGGLNKENEIIETIVFIYHNKQELTSLNGTPPIDIKFTQNVIFDFLKKTHDSEFFLYFERPLKELKRPNFNFKTFTKTFFKGNNNVFKGNQNIQFFINLHNYIDQKTLSLKKQINAVNNGQWDKFIPLKAFYHLSEVVKKYIPICLDIQIITGVPFAKIMNYNLSLIAELNVVRQVLKKGFLIPSSMSMRRSHNKTEIDRFQHKIKDGYIFCSNVPTLAHQTPKKLIGFDLSSAYASCFCKRYQNTSERPQKSPLRLCFVNALLPLLKKKEWATNKTPYKLLINTTFGIINSGHLSILLSNESILRNFTDSCKEEMENVLKLINENLRSKSFELIYGMTDSMYFLADEKRFDRVLTSVKKKLHPLIKLKKEGPWSFAIIFSFNNYIFQQSSKFNLQTDVAKGKFFSSSTIPQCVRTFCFKIVNLFFNRKGVKFTKDEFYDLYETHTNSTKITFDNFMTTTSFSFKNVTHKMIKKGSMNSNEYVSKRDRVFTVDITENGFTRTESLGICLQRNLRIDYNYIYEIYKPQVFNFLKCIMC